MTKREREHCKIRCPKTCDCECHEPLLNSLDPHHGQPCPPRAEKIAKLKEEGTGRLNA